MARRCWTGRVALPGVLALASIAVAACGAPEDRAPRRPLEARQTPFPQHDLEVLGLRIRYIDEGPRRGEPIVLIPGHTSRIEEYDGLVPTLSLRHRVLVLDFPGSGYAEKPDRSYDLRFYEDTLIAFLDALGVERSHLAGGSLGGNLVLRLAHRLPDRFGRLAPWAPGSAWEAQPRLARAIDAIASYVVFWPMVRIQSQFWYRDDWPGRDDALDDTFTYYDEVMGPGFIRMYFGMASDQVERSLFDIAPAIAHPVWLGWGDQDHGANMGEGVARLHELLPHSELHVFSDARHSLAAEIPEPLADSIDEFMRRPSEMLP